MPVPLALKPLWSLAAGSDRFVRTGVHVVPPFVDCSRNAKSKCSSMSYQTSAVSVAPAGTVYAFVIDVLISSPIVLQ